jgi:uncharacterized membrane-anchored protein
MGSARRAVCIAGASLAWAVTALAAAVPAVASSNASRLTPAEKAAARSVVYRSGKLGVRDAVIDLPSGFHYLDARDAQRVLTDLYHNPPRPYVRALILPPRSSVLRNRYFIVVTYENDGHISDRDAQKIDYDAMLRSLQRDVDAHNVRLTKAGYDAVHLVGWAERPRYDEGAHKLYWAKNLIFGSDRTHTLNYEVRTLGREGTLSLHAVAWMPDIGAVHSGMQTVLSASGFVSGRRYGDFREGDRVSNLTVAAVVAGGAYAAAKTGLLALLVAKLKFVVFGIAGLVGALRKRLFGRGRATTQI